jgi:DNA-directed RNA polymerase beta subunit
MLDLGRNQGSYPYFPHEARIRNLTYDINTRVDIQIVKKKRVENKPGDVIQRYEKR